uniref:Uncharacterized protein n=1 Tax=Anguilla anguilla TaxID=7936 RepID=A0A0E9S285_ANGAN
MTQQRTDFLLTLIFIYSWLRLVFHIQLLTAFSSSHNCQSCIYL